MEVKTKEYYEVQEFEEVEEKYTVMETRTEMRDKVVWVKKTVKEEFKTQIPVERTRIIKRPVTRIKSRDVYKVVEVPSNKVVEQTAYRIDTVEDMDTVEITDRMEFELVPHMTGRHFEDSKRIVDTTRNLAVRKKGTEVYHKADTALKNIPEDTYLRGKSLDVMCSPIVDRKTRGSPICQITRVDLFNEYFEVRNNTSEDMPMKDWAVCDREYYQNKAKTNIYHFPDDYRLGPHASVKVYCGKNWNDRDYDGVSCLLWNEKKGREVWNDTGDIAYLFNPEGKLISQMIVNAIKKKRRTTPKSKSPRS
jgi:hypothetical protein